MGEIGTEADEHTGSTWNHTEYTVSNINNYNKFFFYRNEMGTLNSLNQPFDSNLKHVQTKRLTLIIVSSYGDSFDKRRNKQKNNNNEIKEARIVYINH